MNQSENTLASLESKQRASDYERILSALQKKKYSQALLLLSPYLNQRNLSRNEERTSGLNTHFVIIQSAWCYFEQNQFAEAKSYIENGLRTDPLDGPMSLFLAYIYLIEDNKPAAIHRYTLLLDNPFYQEQVGEILEKIRYSDSIAELLSNEPKSFFYKHDLPSMWTKIWLPQLLKKLSNIFKHKSNHNLTDTTAVPKNNFSDNQLLATLKQLVSNKSLRTLLFGIVLLGIIFTIGLWWQGKLGLPKLNLISSAEINSDEEVFKQERWIDYNKDEVAEWLTLYRLLKQAINLRQFNEAIGIYNTINNKDVPIEINNKFFILYRFVVNPQFEDLPTISSFENISITKNQGFFFKFNFKVLQSQKGKTVKFLIELPNETTKVDSTAKNEAGIYLYRAILSIDEKLTDFDFLKPQVQYEAITRLFEVDRNYHHFKVTVVRETIGHGYL